MLPRTEPGARMSGRGWLPPWRRRPWLHYYDEKRGHWLYAQWTSRGVADPQDTDVGCRLYALVPVPLCGDHGRMPLPPKGEAGPISQRHPKRLRQWPKRSGTERKPLRMRDDFDTKALDRLHRGFGWHASLAELRDDLRQVD